MGHYGFEYWLFTFCLYCMVGWLQESAIESLYHRKPVNRGFLKGPYIPIYGVGGLLLLFICQPFRDNPFAVFGVAMLSCTALEYFTGWLMETLFNKQFWDYSMLRFTYKNRISLVTSIFWGIMGLVVTYIISGLTLFVLERLPHPFICTSAAVVSLIMTFDFCYTARKQMKEKKEETQFGGFDSENNTGGASCISRRIPKTGRLDGNTAELYDEEDENDD